MCGNFPRKTETLDRTRLRLRRRQVGIGLGRVAQMRLDLARHALAERGIETEFLTDQIASAAAGREMPLGMV